jgi:hypothetical protein
MLVFLGFVVRRCVKLERRSALIAAVAVVTGGLILLL